MAVADEEEAAEAEEEEEEKRRVGLLLKESDERIGFDLWRVKRRGKMVAVVRNCVVNGDLLRREDDVIEMNVVAMSFDSVAAAIFCFSVCRALLR